MLYTEPGFLSDFFFKGAIRLLEVELLLPESEESESLLLLFFFLFFFFFLRLDRLLDLFLFPGLLE